MTEDDGDDRRHFQFEGEGWLAWVSGSGALGTGALGLSPVDAVHFARLAAPDQPVREALLARGRFAGLYPEELAELLRRATPIVQPPGR
jgi:hypothetical protein